MATGYTSRSNRFFVITTGDNGTIAELGCGATQGQAGGFAIQFAPDLSFVGTIQVVGRVVAVGDSASPPYVPIPYKRVNLLGVASDYGIVADIITPNAIIQVPSNQLQVGLLITCTAGTCAVFVKDWQGATSV